MSNKKLSRSVGFIALIALVVIGFHTIRKNRVGPTQTKEYGVATISKIKAVYDGDTFSANIDEWPPIIGNSVSIRISDIDTPEINSTNPRIKSLAVIARNELRNIFVNGKKIELRNMHRDKYFRINANVYVDEKNVGNLLLKKKLAKKYDGGTKSPWTIKDCDTYEKSIGK